jgi:hypothetical protein
MRRVAELLMVLAAVFGLIGLFFGRASWLGMNRHSIPLWQLLEAIAFALLVIGVLMRNRVNRG